MFVLKHFMGLKFQAEKRCLLFEKGWGILPLEKFDIPQ
jgi:hypothetical protein